MRNARNADLVASVVHHANVPLKQTAVANRTSETWHVDLDADVDQIVHVDQLNFAQARQPLGNPLLTSSQRPGLMDSKTLS